MRVILKTCGENQEFVWWNNGLIALDDYFEALRRNRGMIHAVTSSVPQSTPQRDREPAFS